MLERLLESPYIAQVPTLAQANFLLDPRREVLFGGAAGPGKSSALLMAALLFADVPGYAALLLRRRYVDLALPGALMDRARSWLSATPAHWDGSSHTWTFPRGGSLTFGYLERWGDEERYQSSEFQFIGFDELTQFDEPQYTYLFSRLRRSDRLPAWIPLRMRAASNPGGRGHEWVRRRFLSASKAEDRAFYPARMTDNPHLDQTSYRAMLAELPPHTRAQLERGDWDAKPPGALFRRETIAVVPEPPPRETLRRPVRYWDLAASEPASKADDPDWTVGAKVALDSWGHVWVLDVVRFRGGPAAVQARVRAVAESDGHGVRQRMAQDPGQAGKSQIEEWRRSVLVGWDFDARPESGAKWLRAQPFAGRCGAGHVSLVDGLWVDAFLAELESFSEDPREYAHDDQVDAVSGAFNLLAEEVRRGGSMPMRASPAKPTQDLLPGRAGNLFGLTARDRAATMRRP